MLNDKGNASNPYLSGSCLKVESVKSLASTECECEPMKDIMETNSNWQAKMLSYLQKIKSKNKDFLKGQNIIPIHRAKMVNWVEEIVTKCDLSSDTYFMSIQLMDRYYKYCSLNGIVPETNDIQIIGVCCLFIANKCNDYKNLTSSFIEKNIVRGKYTEVMILNKEETIFKSLNGFLGYPFERTFIGLYFELLKSKIPSANECFTLCEFQSLKNLRSYKLAQDDVELLALGTIYICCNKNENVLVSLTAYNQYDAQKIINIAKDIEKENEEIK
jgi:hypothetical protein